MYNVGIDQKAWAKTSAKWLADKLGGKGDIVEIEGFPGHPANVARMDGVDEVLAKYPDIKVLAKDTGKWDEATGQQVMSNFLSAYPNLTGYWTQDGMAIGALQAVMAANPAEWPQGVGEGRCQFLKLWQEALKTNPNFDSIAVANHPGVSPTGLRIAVNMLQGKKVDKSKLGGANGLVLRAARWLLSSPRTTWPMASKMCEGKPDAYLLDKILTDEEVQQYFVKDRRRSEEVHHRHLESVHQQRIPHADDRRAAGSQQRIRGCRALPTELVIESADTDVAGQIQQLQNLMAKDVDAILVNPGDVNGLNATLLEALNKGIIVISVDQELNVPGVYNVGIDQKAWAKTSAKWLAEKLGGKGEIVEIEGFPGHPANVARMNGVDEVLAKYPDIKVLAKDTGKWDEATGQQVMSNFLAAYPNMTGYWTQDGMAIGALQAVMAANPANWPQGVGEGRCQFLQTVGGSLKQRIPILTASPWPITRAFPRPVCALPTTCCRARRLTPPNSAAPMAYPLCCPLAAVITSRQPGRRSCDVRRQARCLPAR